MPSCSLTGAVEPLYPARDREICMTIFLCFGKYGRLKTFQECYNIETVLKPATGEKLKGMGKTCGAVSSGGKRGALIAIAKTK